MNKIKFKFTSGFEQSKLDSEFFSSIWKRKFLFLLTTFLKINKNCVHTSLIKELGVSGLPYSQFQKTYSVKD